MKTYFDTEALKKTRKWPIILNYFVNIYVLPPLERSVFGSLDFLVKDAKFKFNLHLYNYIHHLCV